MPARGRSPRRPGRGTLPRDHRTLHLAPVPPRKTSPLGRSEASEVVRIARHLVFDYGDRAEMLGRDPLLADVAGFSGDTKYSNRVNAVRRCTQPGTLSRAGLADTLSRLLGESAMPARPRNLFRTPKYRADQFLA